MAENLGLLPHHRRQQLQRAASMTRPLLIAVVTLAATALICTQTDVWNSQPFVLLQQQGITLGSLINIDVPTSHLQTTRVGDIVEGSLPDGPGNMRWKGRVTHHTMISTKKDCVTIKVISDKYIAPGTPVNGKVGGKPFAGTVTGSPNKQRRMMQIEKRLHALEPGHSDEVKELQGELDKMEWKLGKLEKKKSVEQRFDELKKKIRQLQQNPPSKDSLGFEGNTAGFHFVGALGNGDGMAKRIDDLDARLYEMESQATPEDALRPIKKKLKTLEERFDSLTGYQGQLTTKDEMEHLGTQIKTIEQMYGGSADTSGAKPNSKWYGTFEYHGMNQEAQPKSDLELPGGALHKK